jgi:RNA polymerase-binding transcription factor DksA
MATKKAAPKKGASHPPAAAKKAAPKAAAKPVPAKSTASASKATAKVAAPVAKVAAKKPAPPPLARKPVPAKVAPAKAVAAPKKAAPVKAPAKAVAPKAVAPAPEPVKKPVVAAKSPQEVKQDVKPLEKPVAKKEAAKPVKPVVIPKTSTTKSVKYEPDFMKSVLDKKKQQQDSGPTQRYSDGELIEFRDLINRKLDTAKKELQYLQGLITRKDESGDLDEGRYMTMEDGSMSMEREQLSQMASRQIQFIDHLEKALMRIENKTYGICRVTGKLIDKARLRAVPHATLSMEAKQTMNK